MHPDLRRQGTLMRWFLPYYDLGVIRVFRRFEGWVKRVLRPSHIQVWLPRPDGSQLRLCVYRPRRAENLPGLLWLHGGGYAMGFPEEDGVFIRQFMRRKPCVVVAPDYRLSLEAPYPAALEDAWLALTWLRDHAKSLGARPDQLMVGGDSAGGGLTAALCIYARDQGTAPIAYQLPLYPMLDDRPTASNQNNDAPVWNTRSNQAAWTLYLRGLPAGQTSVYAAPARLTDFSGLPPACTIVGGLDPFLDETRTYMEALRAAGVDAQYRVFPGCFHAFDVLCYTSRPAREARRFVLDNYARAVEERFASIQPERLG